MDYLAVNDLVSVDEIVVHPPTRSDEVYVAVYGRSLHETLSSDMSIGTKKADGYLGKITISVENGIVLRVDGNSISAPSPVTRSTLGKVESFIAGSVQRPNLEQLIRIEKAEQEAGGYRR